MPYRSSHHDNDGDVPRARLFDDRVLAILLVLIGGVRVVIAIAKGESFGPEASLAALTAVLGFLVWPWRR